MNKIYIKCPDGFANQLRLSLAANLLVEKKIASEATQEWIVNNHNLVEFLKFFDYLPSLKFEKLTEADDVIKTTSFKKMMETFKCNSSTDLFRQAYSYLKLKEEYKNFFQDFVEKFKIKETIGLHIRTGCKTALLMSDKTRDKPIPQRAIVRFLETNDKKIFLATDNAETQRKFIEIFKDRIILFERISKGEEKFEGMYDRKKVVRYTSDIHTIADFFILQSCRYFIGSNESSFSLMINKIRNNNLDYPTKGVL